MREIPRICIVASRSGMGKTTFLEKLIKELTERDLIIGTIKADAHSFQMDMPGKDTYRHMLAGSKETAIIGEYGYAFLAKKEPRFPIEEIYSFFSREVDFILIEGNKKGNEKKIEIIRKELGNTIVTPEAQLLAVVTDCEDLLTTVPKFDLEDVKGVAELIIRENMNSLISKGNCLTHFNSAGYAKMVDITGKKFSDRKAVASGKIKMNKATLKLILEGKMKKGDVLAVAQVAGIMASKKTSDLIPMCHPLGLTSIDLDFNVTNEECLKVSAVVKTTGNTGVEMEALTAVSVALLTIYDMCKAVDKGMTIENVCLIEKDGGKSGSYKRNE